MYDFFLNDRRSGLEVFNTKVKCLSAVKTFFAISALCNSVDCGLLDNIEVGAEPATG